MSQNAVNLAKSVVRWWRTAQFWCKGDQNAFDDEPAFVTEAFDILLEAGIDYGPFMNELENEL